jgi:plastocyanin
MILVWWWGKRIFQKIKPSSQASLNTLMMRRFLSSLVFVISALANTQIAFDIIWDGKSSTLPLPDLTIFQGDTVMWSRSDSGPFYFYSEITPSESQSGTNYSYTFETTGSFYYTMYSYVGDYTSASGVVQVKEPLYFDQSTTNYQLKKGDMIRWSWEGSTPDLPSEFIGFCSHPGYNHTGSNSFDYTFLVPGQYDWVNSINQYHFDIEDTIDMKHVNIPWNSEFATGDFLAIPYGMVIIFYFTEQKIHNVRLMSLDESFQPVETIFLSQDGDRGKEIYYYPYPELRGYYVALSDYDPDMRYYFYIQDPPQSNESGKSLWHIPKSLVYAAELSLFVFGALGVGNLLMDRYGKDVKKPKVDIPSVGGVGGDITDYALHRSENRIAAAAAKD